MSNYAEEKFWTAFNSPLECGLRSVCILTAAYPKAFDLQRMLHYDYLIVHSGDIKDSFDDAPDSLHPATPNRVGELAVRRELCQVGLRLMIAKGLLACRFSAGGIEYLATDLSLPFLDSLSAEYTNRLRDVASWLDSVFGEDSDARISRMIGENLGQWGAEFVAQSVLLEGDDQI